MATLWNSYSASLEIRIILSIFLIVLPPSLIHNWAPAEMGAVQTHSTSHVCPWISSSGQSKKDTEDSEMQQGEGGCPRRCTNSTAETGPGFPPVAWAHKHINCGQVFKAIRALNSIFFWELALSHLWKIKLKVLTHLGTSENFNAVPALYLHLLPDQRRKHFGSGKAPTAALNNLIHYGCSVIAGSTQHH